MDLIAPILPYTSTALAIALTLSPLKSIQEIKSHGAVQGVPFLPFFAVFLNSILSTLYGVYVQVTTLIFTNAVSACIGAYCVFIYYLYSIEERNKIKIMLLITASGVLAVTYHVFSSVEQDGRFKLGLISNAATIFMFASPLSTMSTVIQTKDASSIPVAMSAASLACSLSWFAYGYTLNDIFVMAPNGVGIILASIQLLLVKAYGQKGRAKVILPT
eukprot:TRINITY_DN22512_c0_g1_i1.p1 TRINITY_DN22512_c0_g1~~TRINITY_DN22512_c0_g1_i1.p1  ORF type:complete len:217 (-),score=18.61 TRINITY_DN22512_c0_g1_i1:76-726(-)